MNSPLRRIGFGFAVLAMCQTFDFAVKPHVPDNEFGAVLYFGVAATFDWIQFYLCRVYVLDTLRRDMEALCIASIFANALGFALYMAPSPPLSYPDAYVWAIQGINYVMAFRLLFMGGGNVLDHCYWRALVRGSSARRTYVLSQRKE